MIRINKVSEYGVLALGYIGSQTKAQSAREVADSLRIPYEITAKTLQRLKEAGFIQSTMGTHGGYRLGIPLSQISFVQVVDALEGPVALVECADHSGSAKECSRTGTCGVQTGMQKINDRIRQVLEAVKLDEFVSAELKSVSEAVTQNG
jgi:Rrf2 family protein